MIRAARYTAGALVLAVVIAACGAPTAAPVRIPNGDPHAPPWLRDLHITPPAGWALTADGRGITNGQFVVSATTLSRSPVRVDAVQANVAGTAHTRDGKTIVIEHQSANRLVAWFTLGDSPTLTTLHMQARTAVNFTQANEALLADMAHSLAMRE